ncbi:MAG: hypothetical protein MJY89_06420 [Bacteroidales bacterium]|nr:hypothetical protein [Bacteroidales bacterium]
MEINGKVHCFFEQSGTFKNEFIKLGIPAEDYDIQNNFGETDHVIDLFQQIEEAYDGHPSIFDTVTQDDLIVAFFPCIYFCDNNNFYFTDVAINLNLQYKDDAEGRYKEIIERSRKRQEFYELLWKLVYLSKTRKLRLVVENPWDSNGLTFLQHNFIKPSVIDNDRSLRGDYLKKPTAYWFIECENTTGLTIQRDKEKTIIRKLKGNKKGLCSEERSMISPDYARNWICDFIIWKKQDIGQLSLF